MKLGLNLSFAAKRWQDPEELAELCAGFGVHYWQFNLDFIDPWWPEEMRNRLANAYRDAFGKKGLSFESLFRPTMKERLTLPWRWEQSIWELPWAE